MRRRESKDGVTVNAVAGTNVVILGFDLDGKRRRRCLGFALQREDKTEGERYWMRGMKTFPSTDPALGPGGTVSSREHPFQTFQWADYSAKPGHEYVYTVIPLYGKPDDLTEGPAVRVPVETEVEIGDPHSVFFNRGSVATQEYARQFQNKAPDELRGEQQEAAYKWLSRGLHEALLAFLERAEDDDWGLYGAVYELRWPTVLEALGDARRRGAKVSVLYHGKDDKTGPQNEEAIAAARIKGICRPRTTGYLMHNKFFVLTKKGKPVAVWTGSTNLTLNGIFGHLNCGHIVEDADVAAEFLTYWRQLCTNSENKAERLWMEENNPRPPEDEGQELTTVFSPHRDNAVLDWYRDISAGAKDALLMSFAFGMNDRFKDVYRSDDRVLRWALMDKASSSGKRRYVEEQTRAIQEIRNRPNVVVAIGNRIETNQFDRWLAELDKITEAVHVPWVHTKFMLVDPLGDEPITVTGSANWSEASTKENAENMLVIRGDKRVADIYLGEFMRLHSHYAFREAIGWAREGGERWEPQNLAEDASWQSDYFDKGSERYWKRRYFAQSA